MNVTKHKAEGFEEALVKQGYFLLGLGGIGSISEPSSCSLDQDQFGVSDQGREPLRVEASWSSCGSDSS